MERAPISRPSENAGGNVVTVSNNKVPMNIYASQIAYNASGKITSMVKGNVLTTYTYDPANDRLQGMVTGNLQDLSYTYDTAGYITAISDNLDPNWDQTFVYDDLYRLTSAQAPVYGTLTYGYNEIGNMTNSPLGDYGYPDPGSPRPHAPTSAGPYGYEYDNNGNMTRVTYNGQTDKTITWTYDNKPSSINSTSFTYDYAGKRVKKVAGSGTTYYFDPLYECTGSTCSS